MLLFLLSIFPFVWMCGSLVHVWVCNKVVTVYICKGKWKASFVEKWRAFLFKHDILPSLLHKLSHTQTSSQVPTAGPNWSTSAGLKCIKTKRRNSLGLETALIALTERETTRWCHLQVSLNNTLLQAHAH